jgi:GNAT superfamily N-acetyltransferase
VGLRSPEPLIAEAGIPAEPAEIKISYLADYPEHVPTLARWLWTQWHDITPSTTLSEREESLYSYLNRDILPLTFIALQHNQLVGSASLRAEEDLGSSDLSGFSPWLGGVFVDPAHRRTGIGTALCRTAERKAMELGYDQLYLFTLDQERWFSSFGWNVIKRGTYHNHPIAIMQKIVGSHDVP